MEISNQPPSKKKTWLWIILAVTLLAIIGSGIYLAGFLKNNPDKNKDQESTTSGPVTISEKILNNKFGFLGGGEPDNPFVGDVGGAWVRPHPGPFLWDAMQKSAEGEIDFSATDELVQNAQKDDVGLLITIWPFAEWDQLIKKPCAVSDQDEFLKKNDQKGRGDYLPQNRCVPTDWTAYEKWVGAVIERYDGDSISDMSGLKIPIKYWEVMNEPDLNYQSNPMNNESERLDFFQGSPNEYAKLLRQTYTAIKKADSDSKVLIAGAAGGSENFLNFYREVFKNQEALTSFDIGNVHCISNDRETHDFNVNAYKKVLSTAGITKPIWVTEAEAFYGKTAEENYQSTLISTKAALAAGAEKIFFTRYNFDDFRTDMSEKKKESESSMKDSKNKYKTITAQ